MVAVTTTKQPSILLRIAVFVAPFYSLNGLRWGYIGGLAAIVALVVLACAVDRFTVLASVPWTAWPLAMAAFLTVGLTLSALR